MPARETDWTRTVAAHRGAARLAYAGVILLATLWRLRLDPDPAKVAGRLERALFRDLSPRDLLDGVRNLALFAGWGAVWLLTGPPGGERRSVRDATLTGMALSVAVETAQLLSRTRNANVLDVLTNTGGALAGALLVALLLRSLAESRAERSFVGLPALVFAGSYAAAAALEALVPRFRQERLPARGGPLDRLEVALRWLERDPALSFPILDLVLFLPAGALWLAMRVERGSRYPAAFAQTVAAGLLLAALAQVGRGAAGYPIQPGAAAAHLLGIVLGAGAAWRWLPVLAGRLRGRERPRALLAAYALLLALWGWRPFLPKLRLAEVLEQFAWSRFVPLYSLAQRMDLFSVADVGIQFLLHLPLGGLLAVFPLRERGPLRHLLPGLYLAAALEAGQVLVAGRYFDLTDLLIQWAGLALGWVLVRRAGFLPSRGARAGSRAGG